jgi:hypothetical protein
VLVIRDASGNFAAGTVTGNLVGDVTGDLTGNVSATSVLPDGVSATTQSSSDNSTKVATTAYADAATLTAGTGISVSSNQISQGATANGFGTRTVATIAPTSSTAGTDGDIYYVVT